MDFKFFNDTFIKLIRKAVNFSGRYIRLFRSYCVGNCLNIIQSSTNIPARIYRVSDVSSPTYFGYYDKIPFSYDNNRLLAAVMTHAEDWSVIATHYPLKLGYFKWDDIVSDKPLFYQFGETTTWSLQQSCMLQWFPEDGNRQVIYNTLVNDQYGSVVQDVFSREILRSYEKPIYAIDPLGQKGVTLNFSRLERLRPGYGYRNLPDQTIDALHPDTDGVWLIDLQQGRYDLLLSLKYLADFEPKDDMTEAVHYVNHLLFSPDGKCLIFLHLWQPKVQGVKKRSNRLMCYDFDSETLHLLDASAVNSHFSWLSNNELVSFQYPLHDIPGYYVYQRDRDTWRKFPLRSIRLSKDGHPTLAPYGDLLVTDTYPDRLGDQHLYLISLLNGNCVEVGRFFSPPRFQGPSRCDLHPRWDRTGSRICIDSAHRGKRDMYVLDLSDAKTDISDLLGANGKISTQ